MSNAMPEQGRGESRRWKRIAAALLLLAGGAIVNVAVAWGSAFMMFRQVNLTSVCRKRTLVAS
jgi:hypothetical protein